MCGEVHVRSLAIPRQAWRYHFTHVPKHVYQKPQSCEVQFLRHRVRQKGFFVILGHLLPFFSTNNTENQNLKKKNKKNIWRCHHFTLVYQKSQYDLQFLIYRVWQTEIGNNVSFFALLSPIKMQKNQAFENMKKNLLELS